MFLKNNFYLSRVTDPFFALPKGIWGVWGGFQTGYCTNSVNCKVVQYDNSKTVTQIVSCFCTERSTYPNCRCIIIFTYSLLYINGVSFNNVFVSCFSDPRERRSQFDAHCFFSRWGWLGNSPRLIMNATVHDFNQLNCCSHHSGKKNAAIDQSPISTIIY